MSQSKENCVAESIRKQSPNRCCLQETHLRAKSKETKSKWMEKVISCKWKLNKIDSKTKAMIGDKDGHYIMIKDQLKRGYNSCKQSCTQYKSTQTYKANHDGHKERSTAIEPLRGFLTPD